MKIIKRLYSFDCRECGLDSDLMMVLAEKEISRSMQVVLCKACIRCFERDQKNDNEESHVLITRDHYNEYLELKAQKQADAEDASLG